MSRRKGIRRDQLGDFRRTGMFSLRTVWRNLARRLPVATDVFRFVAHPRQQAAVWRDYRRTRRDAEFLRRLGPPPAAAPKALIVSLGEQVHEIKVLMFAATALRLRGWSPVVLGSSRSSSRLRRYCRAFGVPNVLAYDEVSVTESEEADCTRRVASFLEGELTFDEVTGWRFRDVWLGPQILSTVSRRMLEGAPDPGDPEVRAEIKDILPQAFRDVYRAERVLEEVGPRLVVMQEVNYSLAAPIVDTAVARGIDVITTRRMWRDDALMSKRLNAETRRIHPASLSSESLRWLAQGSWTDIRERELLDEFGQRYGGVRKLQYQYQADAVSQYSRDELVAKLKLDPRKKIAIVFSHMLWDANLFYGEDLFENFGDWLVRTVGAATRNTQLNWIVKLHPANLYKRAFHGVDQLNEIELIRRHVGELPAHVRLLFPDTDISTLSLFREADYGVTVRGTPGMEMACFGKTVLTAGTGRYSGLGFTVDSSSTEQYLHRLATLQDYPAPDPQRITLAKWHAYGIFKVRQLPLSSFRPEFKSPKGKWHPLQENYVLVARSLEDIKWREDLIPWGMWAAESSSVDYLHVTEIEDARIGALREARRIDVMDGEAR